jgi:hypothetical protein
LRPLRIRESFARRSTSSRTGGLRGASLGPSATSPRQRRSARAQLTDNDNVNGREAVAKGGLTYRELRTAQEYLIVRATAS